MRRLLVVASMLHSYHVQFPNSTHTMPCLNWSNCAAGPRIHRLYISVYILYGSRVISASVIMAAIMNLQIPVRSVSVGSSYVEFTTSKMWV